GLPLQQQWNRRRPVDVVDVIDIATRVRRDGSGREIPRYVIATELGEVDFGLTATMLRRDDGIYVRLAPYRLAYYRDMAPDFQWPPAVALDADDVPMLKVEGLADTGGFLVDGHP
ncbi:MAG TPA: lysine 2,3-aminomutase, partial [Desulfobacterales bacterium]